MNKIHIDDIKNILNKWDVDFEYLGERDLYVSSMSSIYDLKESSVSFIKHKKFDFGEIDLDPTNLIITSTIPINEKNKMANFIIVENPALCFNIIGLLFRQEKRYISRLATIDKSVTLGNNVHIGSNTFIGENVIIGNDVKIEENCVIKNAEIGDNAVIQPGTKIGSMGLGSQMHRNGAFVDFPHFGKVLIHRNVVIQDNVVINRGTLNNTVIRENTRIGPQTWVAHGVYIGCSCFISQSVTIAGSVKIGEQAFIWGNASIRDGLIIGARSIIGMGSVVVSNVPDEEVWVGVPAKRMRGVYE